MRDLIWFPSNCPSGGSLYPCLLRSLLPSLIGNIYTHIGKLQMKPVPSTANPRPQAAQKATEARAAIQRLKNKTDRMRAKARKWEKVRLPKGMGWHLAVDRGSGSQGSGGKELSSAFPTHPACTPTDPTPGFAFIAETLPRDGPEMGRSGNMVAEARCGGSAFDGSAVDYSFPYDTFDASGSFCMSEMRSDATEEWFLDPQGLLASNSHVLEITPAQSSCTSPDLVPMATPIVARFGKRLWDYCAHWLPKSTSPGGDVSTTSGGEPATMGMQGGHLVSTPCVPQAAQQGDVQGNARGQGTGGHNGNQDAGSGGGSRPGPQRREKRERDYPYRPPAIEVQDDEPPRCDASFPCQGVRVHMIRGQSSPGSGSPRGGGDLIVPPSMELAEINEERPTENQFTQAVRQMAREASVDSTREMMTPVVDQIAEQVHSIGQRVLNLDQAGQSAERSFIHLQKLVADLQDGHALLVQQLTEQFGCLRGDLDTLNFRSAQTVNDVASQVVRVRAELGNLESELSQRFAAIDGRVSALGSIQAEKDSIMPPGPSSHCVTREEWNSINEQVTRLLGRLAGLESQLVQTLDLPCRAPDQDGSLAQFRSEMRQWQAKVQQILDDLQSQSSRVADHTLGGATQHAESAAISRVAEMTSRLTLLETRVDDRVDWVLKKGQEEIRKLGDRITGITKKGMAGSPHIPVDAIEQLAHRLQRVEAWATHEEKKGAELEAKFLEMQAQVSNCLTATSCDVQRLVGRIETLERGSAEMHVRVQDSVARHSRLEKQVGQLEILGGRLPVGLPPGVRVSRDDPTRPVLSTATPSTMTAPAPTTACPIPGVPASPLQSERRGAGLHVDSVRPHSAAPLESHAAPPCHLPMHTPTSTAVGAGEGDAAHADPMRATSAQPAPLQSHAPPLMPRPDHSRLSEKI